MDLKDMVKDGKKATFQFYREDDLWYITDDNFEFPVPIKDIKGSTVLKVEKAISLMKFIKRHMDMIEKAKNSP